VDVDFFKDRINEHYGLATIMLANNEIGSMQPIKELAGIAHSKGVMFHTDAVQASGKIAIDVKYLDIDMLSVSGHKFHGPKGVGVLYVRKGTNMHAMIGGGHQEGGLRSGTYNVPGIVGMGEAAKLVNSLSKMRTIRKNAESLYCGLDSLLDGIKRNGNPELSVAGVVNICFDDVEAKSAVLKLSNKGVCCSSGSACNEGQTSPSHVLKAIGCSTRQAHSSLRFSLSRDNTEEEIDEAVMVIAEVIKECRIRV